MSFWVGGKDGGKGGEVSQGSELSVLGLVARGLQLQMRMFLLQLKGSP